jgi:hypothetical protein
MPYDRISPFGVQRDLVSQGERFRAENESRANARHQQMLMLKEQSDAMRRAQSATSGGGGPADEFGVPLDAMTQAKSQGYFGAPDPLQRRANAEQAGWERGNTIFNKESDLAKQIEDMHTQRVLKDRELQMAPRNAEIAQEDRQWKELAGRRGLEDEELRNRNAIGTMKAELIKRIGSAPPPAAPSPQGGLGKIDIFGGQGDFKGVPYAMPSAPAPAAPDFSREKDLLTILTGGNPDLEKAKADQLKIEIAQLKRDIARANAEHGGGKYNKETDTFEITPKPESLHSVIRQKLPRFINRDTESAWSRATKGASAGAVGGAGIGAGAGAFFGGIGAGPGAVGGGILGGIGGGIAGALSGPDEPSDADAAGLKTLFQQLVQSYAANNGGNMDLAKQQAMADFEAIAKESNQGSDWLDDWDADKTMALFQGLR